MHTSKVHFVYEKKSDKVTRFSTSQLLQTPNSSVAGSPWSTLLHATLRYVAEVAVR